MKDKAKQLREGIKRMHADMVLRDKLHYETYQASDKST